MSNSLDLLCSFNTDYILPSAQQRLLYALLAVRVGELLIEPAPVTLDLVVDASASMQIPLAHRGAVRGAGQPGCSSAR
ncbi:MAG: hypothetical protein V9H69_22600 [Anaerolineae bacterium]